MNRRTHAYVIAVTIAAALLLVTQRWSALLDMAGSDIIGLAAFTILTVTSEFMAVDFAIGSKRTAKSSMAFLPLLTCATVYPPTGVIAVSVLSEGITQALAKRRTAWKFSINVSQTALATGAAAYSYSILGGNPEGDFQIRILAFFVMSLTFFISNMLIVSVFYAIRNSSRFLQIFRQVIGPGGINILYGLLASPIAIFAAYLYDMLHIGGIVLLIMPLLLIRYSYLSKVQLQQANQDLLKVLIKTIETRDPYTSGHSLRVSRFARVIASDMQCSAKEVERIETAALLHDIGKIDSIYAEIIRKPAALTEHEHRVIKTHSVKGAELLQNLTSFSDDIIRGVRHHHERYDGRGYPDGLRGDAIPLAARIIMLCDSIDAMLSDRPYRSALSVEQVTSELTEHAGAQFDPDIVAVLLNQGTLTRLFEMVRSEQDVSEHAELIPS